MYKFLQKTLPQSVKERLYNFIKKEFQKKWIEKEQTIPRYEISTKHILHLASLPNRGALLEQLPKHAVVAEIGVDRGAFSEQILEITEPEKLHLVDAWQSERYHKGLQKMVEKKFKEQIDQGKLEIHVGLSTEAVDDFENDYFDWIYIDTDHSYKTTRDELQKYAPKVKQKGIIGGHDFIIGNWNSMERYGVKEAVYEFCVKNDWEILYLTMENTEFPSFAIRRIGK